QGRAEATPEVGTLKLRSVSMTSSDLKNRRMGLFSTPAAIGLDQDQTRLKPRFVARRRLVDHDRFGDAYRREGCRYTFPSWESQVEAAIILRIA
ncbi:MAG TPA: hypothetical protein VKS78_01995, partial [Roseiarcus sp.]|nr:hypothetical protein [Roseiarcus sp.]